MHHEQPLSILALGGSLRQHSIARRALHEFVIAVEARGASVLDYNVRDHPLPLFNEDDDTPATLPPAALALRTAAQAADALIIATPEYHNSIAGAVKNSIDWLKPRDIRDKPVALLAVGGSAAAGHRALTHLRQVVRGLGAFALPGEVTIGRTDDIDMTLPWPDPAIERTIQRLAGDLLRYGSHFRGLRDIPTR